MGKDYLLETHAPAVFIYESRATGLFVRFAILVIWDLQHLPKVQCHNSLHQTQQVAAEAHAALQKSTGVGAGFAAAKNRESSSIVSNSNVRVTYVAHIGWSGYFWSGKRNRQELTDG